MTTATKNIIYKLETLPKELVKEVEDFIDFLKVKHEQKSNYTNLAEPIKLKNQKVYMVQQKVYLLSQMILINH